MIYVGANPGKQVSTAAISSAYGISKHHLVRVVHTLHKTGYLNVTAGRTGGVSLAKDPADIRLGQVIRKVEPNLNLVECFDKATNTCPIIDVCDLKPYLRRALEAFLDELDRHTLADLLAQSRGKNLAKVLVKLGAA